MEILWWLAPPAVATGLAMVWVSWLGRAGRGQVDPEVAVRRLGDAMARPTPRVPDLRAADERPGGAQHRGRRTAVQPSVRHRIHPSSLLIFAV